MGWGRDRCIGGCVLCAVLGTAQAGSLGAPASTMHLGETTLDAADLYAIGFRYSRTPRWTSGDALAASASLPRAHAAMPLLADMAPDLSPIDPAPELVLRPRSSHGLIDIFGWEEDRLSQAATYRSSGPVYFKGKAGYLYMGDDPEDAEEFSLGRFVGDFNNSGALGLGAGYKLSNGERFEIEYVVNKKDVQVFSIGYTF